MMRFDMGYYITREPNVYSDTNEIWLVVDRNSTDRWAFDTPKGAVDLLRVLSEKRVKKGG